MKKNKQGQVWSMDMLISVGVFMLSFIIFYLIVLSTSKQGKMGVLIEENEMLVSAIQSSDPTSDISFVVENVIDEEKLKTLAAKDYDTIKKELGMVSDFCMYFADQEGKVKDMGGIRFIGSPQMNITVKGFVYSCNGTLFNMTQCNDQVDNDGDTLIDFPSDPECHDRTDDDEGA